MEGDDDFAPFYDNRADVYGHVIIENTKFELPQLTDNNNPTWDPADGTFVAQVTGNPVPIRIELYEGDSLATGPDDTVDINTQGGKSHLDLLFNMCSLRIDGDLQASAQTVIESAGTGSSGGRIRFTIEMADGSPESVDDLAIVELGLVQVIQKPTRLIAGKPTVLMARVANNSSEIVETQLHVHISGQGVNIVEDFPLKLNPGELRKEYFHQSDPLILPANAGGYELYVQGAIDDPFSPKRPISDCRRINDEVEKPFTPILVVNTRDLHLMWTKVGAGFDIGNFVPDDHFKEIIELGGAYIQATYPVANAQMSVAPFPIAPPATAVYDWMTALLSFLPWQGGARSLTPFVLVWELNLIAMTSGIPNMPTIMGVLPSHDWFKQFVGWEKPDGVSMGPYAPRAVIFNAKSEDDRGFRGPELTLPAHELGHTFGLSIDSRLKDSFLCDVSWPVVGSLPCDASGGLDEYKHDDPILKPGNPASGYWVHQPNEPGSVSAPQPNGQPNSMSNNELCDTHCFMGTSPIVGSGASDASTFWPGRERWIDRADYEHLVDKLEGPDLPFPLAAGLVSDQSLYVSGIIAWNDKIYIGPLCLQSVQPELTRRKGLYGIRSLDSAGRSMAEVGLPLNWNVGEYDGAFPFTTFSVTIPFHPEARSIEFVNRGTGVCLGKQELTRSRGVVSVSGIEPGTNFKRGEAISLKWSVKNGSGSETGSVVLVSPGKDIWWPATALISDFSHDVDTSVLEPGSYVLRVTVLDGIDVLVSGDVNFEMSD